MRNGLHSAKTDDPSTNSAVVFLIGSAELDLRTRQLRFDGNAVDVQPKVFDLLAYLVCHRDRVVGKDELFDQVWPSVVVSDASLSQTIKRARDLFRSAGFERDIIRTVARRGYQFDHEVSLQASVNPDTGGTARTGAQGSPPLSRYLFISFSGLLVFTALLFLWPLFERDRVPLETPSQRPAARLPGTSIAVLPFANLTPDERFAYFADGLTETLINNLATVRGLRVIARSSAFSANRDAGDAATIGAQLGVAYLLEGSVQRDRETLRISARLTRAADGLQLWSQQFTRLMDDVFSVQDTIAQSVVAELGNTLDTALNAPRATGIAETAQAAEAYRLVLRGNRERRRGSEQSVREAELLFREALALAPNFGPALVALSEAVRWRGVTGSLAREPAFREAMTLLERAVRLDPDNGLAYQELAELQHRHFWNFDAARNSFNRALEVLPGSGDLYSRYSRFLAKAGDARAAVIMAREAASMNPRSTNVQTNLVLRLIKARELDEARDAIGALRSLDSEHVDLPWLETNWHLRIGNDREALQWITLEELDHLRLSLSAVALQRLGRTDQAQAALGELVEKDAEGSAFQIAETYAQWGDANRAFEWLERALSSGDPGLAELYSSLNLESLYSDARFARLAEQIGLPPPGNATPPM